MEKWQSLHSRYVVNDRWMKLRSNAYRTPAGDTLDPYYIRELEDWIGCLAVDQDLNVFLIDQYRPGADRYIREIIAGGVETTDDSPRDAAQRELSEEIGYVGGDILGIGSYWSNPAMQTNRTYSFIALGGKVSQSTYHEPGETIAIVKTTLPDLLSDISSLQPQHQYQGLHIAIIFQAVNFINHSDHPDALKLRQQIA